MRQTLNSRRSFIAAAGLFFATTALKAAPKDFSGSNVRYGMAIDLTRCVDFSEQMIGEIIDEDNDREDKKFGSFFKKYLNTRAGGDCSGFVSIVNAKYQNMYFDEKTINRYYDNGGRKSKAIYNFYESKNLITHKNPKIGDLVFFSNTLGKGVQKNKDKKNITHVGIVTAVLGDETVKFIHNSGGKIIHSYMNLKQKNVHLKGNQEINSYLVRCSNSSCLAANRFAGYGKAK